MRTIFHLTLRSYVKLRVDPDVMRDVRQTALAAGAEIRRREKRRGHIVTDKRRKKKVLPATTQSNENTGQPTGESAEVSS